jgi:hypothetical protein
MIETHLGISPRIYYAKPQNTSGQIVVSPWATDAITLTEQGTTGVYTFTRSASVAYVIYERVGATPASTDPIDAHVPIEPAIADVIANQQTIIRTLNNAAGTQY